MKHADAHGIYSTQATVRTYESGADGLMKPETVLHWFQEIAEATPPPSASAMTL